MAHRALAAVAVGTMMAAVPYLDRNRRQTPWADDLVFCVLIGLCFGLYTYWTVPD